MGIRRGGPRRHHFKIESFEHEDGTTHDASGFVKELDDATIMLLDDFIGDEIRFTERYRPGMARVAVLSQALEGLKIDERSYDLKKTNKPIPRYWDPEREKSLMDEVLGWVIHFNPFFVEQDKFVDVFGPYALEIDEQVVEEQQDPTESLT